MTLTREITVDGPLAVVQAAWPAFVQAARRRPGHLTCDELACIDALATGAVAFAARDPQRTVVTATLDEGEAGLPPDAGRHLARDLVLFKDFAEAACQADGTASERPWRAAEERRRQHLPAESAHEHDEPLTYTDRFPT